MPSSQFAVPRLLDPASGSVSTLERVDFDGSNGGRFDEAWLQQLLFEQPELLPVEEIDPVFGDLVPVCRELRTGVGPLDLLCVNSLGLPTLVECKLWRNPEARRKVVGQILDYAQELSRWTYSDLVEQINRSTGGRGDTLYQTVAAQQEDGLDEAAFIDAVAGNLKRGRFLLLIVGDGIRESVEQIADYLQQHAQLNFTFGLVEQAIHRVGEGESARLLVQPRVLARSVEIERAVVRIEETGGAKVESATATPVSSSGRPSEGSKSHAPKRRGTISEQYFFESLEKLKPGVADPLRDLFAELESRGLKVEAGDKSMKIKATEGKFNFLTIDKEGCLRNYGLGRSELGRTYLSALKDLFSDTTVIEFNDRGFRSSIQHTDGSWVTVPELLEQREAWLTLIDETLATHLASLDED